MINDNALISTAILTAIWDENHNDNIELIKPFIMKIISDNFRINEVIDEFLITEKMSIDYGFNKFPLGVLKVVLNRMTKNQILKKDYKHYYLKRSICDETNEFSKRKDLIKQDVNEVLKCIKDYVSNQSQKVITIEETEVYLLNFISSYGYNTYNNINYVKTIDIKKDYVNYLIGECICTISERNHIIFQKLLNIIKGYMLANAIYLQIENDNKSSLKKLTCFLDTPLILSILGLKTNLENKSAKELLNLLKKYGAKTKCFQHTFLEIQNIIHYYQIHINDYKISTLEYFDENNYSSGMVQAYLSSLEEKFKENDIEIEDCPDYQKSEKYLLDTSKLYELLEQHKIDKKTPYVVRTIQNDVDSVAAINYYRKGRKYNKIENCEYIFISTYQFLRTASRELTNAEDYSDIGLVIDDLDLTTILWLKDFSNSSYLPKMRLIENALAATYPSDDIMKKAIPIFQQLKKDKVLVDIDNISDVLNKYYFRCSGLADVYKNDPDLLTKESFENYIKSKDSAILESRIKIEQLESKLKNMDDLTKNNIINHIDIKYNNITEKALKIVKVLFLIIMMILSSLIYLGILVSLKDLNICFFIVLLIYNLYNLITTIINKFNPLLEKVIRFTRNIIIFFKQKEINIELDRIKPIDK